MVRLSFSLGQLVSVIFIVLTCPLVVLTHHSWASHFQDPEMPPLQPTTPQKIGFKESLLFFTTSNHPLTSQSKQLSPTAPR